MITEEQQAILNSLVDPDDPEPQKYQDDKPIQQEVLCLMIRDKYFMDQSFGLIRPEYFVDKAHALICKIVLEFFEQNQRKWLPDKKHLINELKIRLKDNPAINYYLAELQAVLASYEPELSPRESLLKKITEFAKQQGIRLAISKVIDLIQKPTEDRWLKVEDTLKTALLIGPNTDLGLEYFATVEERYERMMHEDAETERFSSGFEQIDKALVGGGLSRGEIGAFMAMPGCGKTWRKNTKVLMFDGSSKKVQDIVVGDILMGPDSKPRTVINTHKLMDYGYRVKPVKGDSYVVNGEHILSLKNSHRSWKKSSKTYEMGFSTHPSRMGNTDIFNISVKDFLKENVSFRKKMKGWRSDVTWNKKEVKIDPYILGVWLGDGDYNKTAITNTDKEIIESWFYNLFKNKHIPHVYKQNDRETRLQVLAGLIDTDGSLNNNNYEITQKQKILAEDIVFLARSLGFAAYMKRCKKSCQTGIVGIYWRICISGNCSEIPVRIKYKKSANRRQNKNVLVTGIKVIPTNKLEEFYGFEVDGDHLLMLDDFTVQHNSVSLVKSTVRNINRGKRVLYISLEMDQDKIAERFDTMLTGVGINELKDRRDEVIMRLRQMQVLFKKESKELGDQRLFVKQFAAGSADVTTIRAFMSQLSLQGFKPDLVIIDYVGEFKDLPGMKKWESLQRIVRDLRGMAVEEKICILTAMQPNRAGRDAQNDGFIDDSEIGDAFGQARPMDAIWSINMNKVEQECKVGRIFVVKHRHGKSRFSFHFQQDANTLDMVEISENSYRNILSSYQDKATEKTGDALDNVKATSFKPNSD
jgi:replicative DNA helicase